MNIIIRTDASVSIGTGHIMRTLTLAKKLKAKGRQISFISREYQGNLIDYIKEQGFNVYHLPAIKNPFPEIDAEQTIDILKQQTNTIDLIVIDHYAIDITWEKKIRPYVNKIMVIDDLANRKHDCDILLDQNLYQNMESRYETLVPKTCKLLLGPKYALLREEFIEARKHRRKRTGKVERILIFFGGSDPTNETEKALQAIKKLDRPDIKVDVIVGKANPNKEKIKQLTETMPHVNYYCQVNNMAELMNRADLAVGAGGSTTWERCYLGLPTITVVIAENQKEITETLEIKKVIVNLGIYTEVSIETVYQAIIKAINNQQLLKDMEKNSLRIMGKGTESNQVIQMMLEE